METLVCKGVSKTYGKKQVLNPTDLTFEKGKIYGLIGRNGAGKTTLLSILSAQNPATAGEVTVCDATVWENREGLDHICFSREINNGGQQNYIAAMKVKAYLDVAARHYAHWDAEMADKLVKAFGLDTKKRLSKLSKGMLSMVTIIIAMASKADFTFMDEPVAGLDVVVRDQFYRMIIDENTATGRCFVISTHIIDEASNVFEDVIMIDKGSVILKENTADLLDRAYTVSGLAETVDAAVAGCHTFGAHTSGRSKTVTVLLEGGQQLGETPDLTVTKPTLQQFFVARCGAESLL